MIITSRDYKQIPLTAKYSPKDHRDFISTAVFPQDIVLPTKLSFKDKIKTILDQGQWGICVGCASADMKNVQEFDDNNLPDGGLSPVYTYTLAKQIDGIPNEWGTYPKSILQVLSTKGILSYNDMPISLLNSSNGQLPTITQEQINKALPYKIMSYAQVPLNINAIKQAMVSTKSPLILTVLVTDSFYYPEQNKYIGKPTNNIYGGHGIAIVSYDDDMEYTYKDGSHFKGFIEIQNSWSSNWGNGGFAYIPYDALNWLIGANQLTFIMEVWSSFDDHSDAKNKYWRIQCGSFSVKEHAQTEQLRLKNLGLSTYLVNVNNLWKIQIGAWNSELLCRAESQRIKTQLHVDNFVTYY